MAILITGGTGFLGSHLARRLVRAGETKIVLIDAYPNPAYVDDIADRVEIVRGDFSESTELLAVLKQHDFSHVFHLGYLTAEADLFPAQAIRINILGTNNLFELARQCGVHKICYASSAAVYRSRRAGDQLWHEDDRPTPTSFYGFCKLSNEYTAELYYLKYGLKHVGLRLQSIYGFGRGQRRGINPDIYARIVESPFAGVPFVAPHTDAVLSWTYVEDAAEAFYLAYKVDDTPHRIFNVTGEIRTVGEAVGHINSRLQESCLETGSELAVTLPLADGGRIREELGFVPAYSMERGIDAYIERLNDR